MQTLVRESFAAVEALRHAPASRVARAFNGGGAILPEQRRHPRESCIPIRAKAPAPFPLALSLLLRQPTLARGRRRPRLLPLFPRSQRIREQSRESFDRRLAIGLLAALAAGNNPQTTVLADPRGQPTTDDRLLFVRQCPARGHVKAQQHLRRQLVDILSAGTGAARKRILQFLRRDAKLFVDLNHESLSYGYPRQGPHGPPSRSVYRTASGPCAQAGGQCYSETLLLRYPESRRIEVCTSAVRDSWGRYNSR